MPNGFIFKFDLNPNLDVRSGLEQKDYRYLNKNPDPDFSPERNAKVIQETINEATKYHNDWKNVLTDEGRNRMDILSSYATYTLSKGGSKNLKQYLGNEAYKEIIGDKVVSKLRVAQTSNVLGGRPKQKPAIAIRPRKGIL